MLSTVYLGVGFELPIRSVSSAAKGPEGSELLTAAQAINERIAAVARAKKFLKGDSDTASAAELADRKWKLDASDR